uniref:Uncharacterized protein n=1 Tax=Arundo donax TaxID=35708 RepID=A0A0A9S9V2_ARUDO
MQLSFSLLSLNFELPFAPRCAACRAQSGLWLWSGGTSSIELKQWQKMLLAFYPLESLVKSKRPWLALTGEEKGKKG